MRDIDVQTGDLVAIVEGDIEEVEKTIKISEIRVTYKISVEPDKLDKAKRALAVHPAGCPAHESTKGSIRIKVDADFS